VSNILVYCISNVFYVYGRWRGQIPEEEQTCLRESDSFDYLVTWIAVVQDRTSSGVFFIGDIED
jgi:hypothetical protein